MSVTFLMFQIGAILRYKLNERMSLTQHLTHNTCYIGTLKIILTSGLVTACVTH